MDNFINNFTNILNYIKYNRLMSLLIFLISLIILINLISFFGYITMTSHYKFFDIVYTLGYNIHLTDKVRSFNYYLNYNQALCINFIHKNGHHFEFITSVNNVFNLIENTVVDTLNEHPNVFDRDKYIIKTDTSEYITYGDKQIIKADRNNVKFKDFLKDLEDHPFRVVFDDKFIKYSTLDFTKEDEIGSYKKHIDETESLSNLINFLKHKNVNKGSLIYYALLNDKKNYCSFLINYYIGVR